MMGGRKYSTEYFEVEKQLDLRLNLESRHIPVVYGVQKIDSFPAFADVVITPDTTPNETGSNPNQFTGGFTTMYSANVLCEGPISALFDVFVDDESLVCKDLADENVRKLGGPGTVSSNDTVRGVACFGSMEKGDVAGGQFFNEISAQAGGRIASTPHGTFIISGGSDPTGESLRVAMVLPDGTTVSDLNPNYTGETPAPDQRGVLHEKSLGPLVQAKNLKLTFHSGKDDQEANKILMNKAAGEGSTTPLFLGQQQYANLGLDPGTYWGQSHRLLDTAYVVLEDKVSDTDAQLPDISYVVKGKFINSFNYDGSYRNNLVRDSNSVQHVDYFDLADDVTISPYYRSGAKYNATIIDKWFFADMDGEYDFRFRFKAGTRGIVSVQNPDEINVFSSSSAPGIRTGDKVKYKASGTAISGLVNNTEYFAVYNSNSANTLKLASTKENAEAGTTLSIAVQALPTGTHELELLFLDEQLINDGIKRFTVESTTQRSIGGQTVTPNFTCTSETFGGEPTLMFQMLNTTVKGTFINKVPTLLRIFLFL